MSDCTIGKDFNPKTCRWIKGCRNGYSRNENFKCVRGSKSTKKVEKEAFDLVKELFSNQNNGLTYPISPERTITRKKSFDNFNEFNSGLNLSKKTSSYSELKQRIKQFIETIDENILNIESDVFELAKSRGIQTKNPRQQYLLRKMLMEHISNIKGKKEKKNKSVKFAKTSQGFSELANNSFTQTVRSKPIISKTKRPVSKTSKLSKKTNETPITPITNPIQMTNEEMTNEEITNEKINIFLNKLGMKIVENLTTKMVATNYKSSGIQLDTKKQREDFRKYVKDFFDSYTIMNDERALNALELKKDYTHGDLEQQYKNRSRDIFTNKNLNIEDKRIEYDRLDNAYSKLKEKLEKSAGKEGDDTVFMFYSKSKDLPPGMGAGEKILKENISKYEGLSKIKDWRKKLSNFWIQPFEIDGKKWQSVEHYYQGSKFKGTPEFFNQFSLDSGSDLSKDPLLAKAAGGKTGKFGKERIRPKEIVMDSNFFEGRHSEEMFKGQFAKFTQNIDLMDMLLKTKDAQLVHYTRGGKPIVFTGLMLIRTRNK